jgi:methylenetetrahydrofolate reductase (NADPH)
MPDADTTVHQITVHQTAPRQSEQRQSTQQTCPKRMVYGPCGGVRADGGCEMDTIPCVFVDAPLATWAEPVPDTPPTTAKSALLATAKERPVVLTDLTLNPFDVDSVTRITEILVPASDALLVGEHQNRPDFPPALLAALIRRSGGVPWMTLTCRDRNRLVLEQDVAGLLAVDADGVLCVTGDGRAHGTRAGVTQVFDLDGPRLAALASSMGAPVAVAESPQAEPRPIRPQRVALKQQAGADICFLNHVGSPGAVAEFIVAAREAGATLPFVAGVAVFTDARSAAILQAFPGLDLDSTTVERVLESANPRVAGIEAAVVEARALMEVPGVVGVNISGLASSAGLEQAARIKAEVGHEILGR